MRRKDREVKDDAVIDSIIQKCDTLHLGLFDGHEPYVIPLNFGYTRNGQKRCFYFHGAAEGRKLDIIKHHPEAAFQLDTEHELVQGEKPCDWGMKYKCVMGTGKVTLMTEAKDRTEALDAIMLHYNKGNDLKEGYNEEVLAKTITLKLEVKAISCKIKE